jgi:folate-binding protein YgfZ
MDHISVMSSLPRLTELPDRAVLAVSGPDWRSFLQGLLTQDVETLADGEARFGALLTPQGRLLFDLFIVGTPDGALLDVARDRREALAQRLAMYRLRAQVAIAPAEDRVFVLWGGADGPAHEDVRWMPDPRLPGLGFRAYGAEPPAAPGALPATPDDYDAHRLALGAPDPARDFDDKTYPIEADFDLLNGIDFKKGCYVGQETTSRMKRRGGIKSRTVRIVFEGPPPAPGTPLTNAEGLRAGEVLSGREGAALALIRLERALGAELSAEGRSVSIRPSNWLDLGR